MSSTLQVNMSPGVTPISRDIYDLHMTIFWICVAIGVIVFGVMAYSLVRHRKSIGHEPAKFHEHPFLEILWAAIPMLILIIMAVPATIVLVRMNDASDSALTIKITGYQWKWKYEYLDQGISFFSNLATPQDEMNNETPKNQWYLLQVDHPLILPVNEKIRFLITSNDVIHSWWVPALGIKKDAIPGYIHEAWARIDQPGTYRGQCAELCGTNHGFMPIVVIAVPQGAFQTWVKEQTQRQNATTGTTTSANTPMQGQITPSIAAIAGPSLTKAQLMKEGEDKYNTNCSACHKVDGSGMPPTFPAMKGSKVATGPLAAHIDIVLNGKPGTAMQPFGKILNDEDIAAIITYERNAFGNNTGDVVQPSQISDARSN